MYNIFAVFQSCYIFIPLFSQKPQRYSVKSKDFEKPSLRNTALYKRLSSLFLTQLPITIHLSFTMFQATFYALAGGVEKT